MGLKQRVLFESQQPVVGFSYNKELVQGTFIHTLYQGLNEKNSHVRRDLKPFLWQAGRTSRHWLSPTKVACKTNSSNVSAHTIKQFNVKV